MPDGSELVRLADLLKLGAATVNTYVEHCETNGETAHINELARRLEDISVELRGVGEQLASSDARKYKQH